METITVNRQNKYKMPIICHACGELALTYKLPAEKAFDYIILKRTISLPFPLCDMCAHAYNKVRRRDKIGYIVSLGLTLFLFIGLFSIDINITPGSFLDYLSLILIILVFLPLFGNSVIRRIIINVSTEKGVSETYERVIKAACITDIGKRSITIEFTNKKFAELFKLLNEDTVLNDKKSI